MQFCGDVTDLTLSFDFKDFFFHKKRAELRHKENFSTEEIQNFQVMHKNSADSSMCILCTSLKFPFIQCVRWSLLPCLVQITLFSVEST